MDLSKQCTTSLDTTTGHQSMYGHVMAWSAGVLWNVYPPTLVTSTDGLLCTSAQNDTATSMESGTWNLLMTSDANVLSVLMTHIANGIRSAANTHGSVRKRTEDQGKRDCHTRTLTT